MSRVLRRSLLTAGVVVGLLVAVGAAVLLFVDVDRFKPRLEAVASSRLGMDFRVGGRLSVRLFPLRVTAEECRILSGQGVTVASASRVGLRIALLPLLRGDLRLRRIEVTRPRFSVERDSTGGIRPGSLKWAPALLRALDGGTLSLSDGTLRYLDGGSGGGFEATGLDLHLSRVRLAQGRSPQLAKGLSLRAELTCDTIRTKTLTLSALKVSVEAKDGVFEFAPVTLRIFGGQLAGSLRADASGPVPLYQARCSLPRFRIEEFLRTLSPGKAAVGAMDFSASLRMRGGTVRHMVETAAGAMSLRGRDLVLEGTDLDRGLSRFASSQSFSLVDIGAVFFAGPVGLAVTKGYDFAGLFRGTGGSSRIHALVSDWTVERGVAQAKDVALATTRNRIALQGGLDFVNGRFADVTVAAIDEKGCARVKQEIHGSFAKPVVEKPNVLRSMAGPALKLLKMARRLLPSGPCEAFYSGSVAPPR